MDKSIVPFGSKYFWDIPIYRLDENIYREKMNQYIEKNMHHLDRTLEEKMRMDEFYKRNPDIVAYYKDHFQKRYGGIWQFNEIIGYLRLYFRSHSILGELWLTDSKRFTRTRKKLFKYITHKAYCEQDFCKNASSNQVFETIKQYLYLVEKDFKIKHKTAFFDTTIFLLVGQTIDWRVLFTKSFT